MTTLAHSKIHDIEEAASARWLTGALVQARKEVRSVPTAEAVDRIRDRVFGEGAARKTPRRIAA